MVQGDKVTATSRSVGLSPLPCVVPWVATLVWVQLGVACCLTAMLVILYVLLHWALSLSEEDCVTTHRVSPRSKHKPDLDRDRPPPSNDYRIHDNPLYTSNTYDGSANGSGTHLGSVRDNSLTDGSIRGKVARGSSGVGYKHNDYEPDSGSIAGDYKHGSSTNAGFNANGFETVGLTRRESARDDLRSSEHTNVIPLPLGTGSPRKTSPQPSFHSEPSRPSPVLSITVTSASTTTPPTAISNLSLSTTKSMAVGPLSSTGSALSTSTIMQTQSSHTSIGSSSEYVSQNVLVPVPPPQPPSEKNKNEYHDEVSDDTPTVSGTLGSHNKHLSLSSPSPDGRQSSVSNLGSYIREILNKVKEIDVRMVRRDNVVIVKNPAKKHLQEKQIE